MRFLGLTLCLLASSFGARAESVEERVAALEARVKALEQALRTQASLPAANIDGSYKGQSQSGETITVQLAGGRFVATADGGTKTGPYEVVGDKIVVTVDGKPEVFLLQGDHIKNDKIDLIKSK